MGTCGAAKTPKYALIHDVDWLTEHYVTQGLSCGEVAEIVGCNRATVEYALKKFDIPRRGRHSGRWNPKKCGRCGEEFIPGGPAARFCSAECRTQKRECKACARTFRPEKLATGQQAPSLQSYCSEECRSWAISRASLEAQDRRRKARRPRRRLVHGYVHTYYGASQADGGGFIVIEHRQVMEDSLGRELLSTETVHHINGDNSDNRIENLQLRQGPHSKGAVFRCNSCGSHDVVAVEITTAP